MHNINDNVVQDRLSKSYYACAMYNEKYFQMIISYIISILNLEGIKDVLCYKFRRPMIGQNCSTVCTNKCGHRDAFLNEWCKVPRVLRGLAGHVPLSLE